MCDDGAFRSAGSAPRRVDRLENVVNVALTT